MILVAIGANLPGPFGPPRATCEAAVAALAGAGTTLLRRSRWYESAPVPLSSQPWYVNGVVAIATQHDPVALLSNLHEIESQFGRVRSDANAARTLDLDLLDYDGLVRAFARSGLRLPHPRMAGRPFVLLPLTEIAPGWRHPVSGARLQSLVRSLPWDALIRPCDS